MTRRILSNILVLLTAVLVPATAVLGVEPPQLTPAQTARLEALRPDAPEAYFELGEDIADSAAEPATLELARQLLVLAFHLDRVRGSSRLAAASCLALADLSTLDRDRRWLSSLAVALDRRHARAPWVQRSLDGIASQTGYLASVAVGLVRSGEGIAARKLLEEPSVRQVIQTYERLLSPVADTGGLKLLDREAERWPCPECHNARIVKRLQPGREAQFRLCTNCEGNPGPRLTSVKLASELRFESVMLRGVHRSWSAQVAADQGAPLRDPDPEELARTLGVDPNKTVWRNGMWVDPRAAAAVPAAGVPKPEAEKPPAEQPAAQTSVETVPGAVPR